MKNIWVLTFNLRSIASFKNIILSVSMDSSFCSKSSKFRPNCTTQNVVKIFLTSKKCMKSLSTDYSSKWWDDGTVILSIFLKMGKKWRFSIKFSPFIHKYMDAPYQCFHGILRNLQTLKSYSPYQKKCLNVVVLFVKTISVFEKQNWEFIVGSISERNFPKKQHDYLKDFCPSL